MIDDVEINNFSLPVIMLSSHNVLFGRLAFKVNERNCHKIFSFLRSLRKNWHVCIMVLQNKKVVQLMRDIGLIWKRDGIVAAVVLGDKHTTNFD